jgi:phosphotransacetylase
MWLGCIDPVQTMEETRASDPVLNTLRAVLEAWRGVFSGEGRTVQQVAAAVEMFDPNTREGEALTELRAALAPVAVSETPSTPASSATGSASITVAPSMA